jgi:transcriptional antiterminator Rof (Rho-off)
MSDYAPIACVAHEKLEFAVLKGRRLRLRCREIGEIAGLPVDVYTQDKAEWLKLRDEAGVEHVIRLDHILVAEEI